MAQGVGMAEFSLPNMSAGPYNVTLLLLRSECGLTCSLMFDAQKLSRVIGYGVWVPSEPARLRVFLWVSPKAASLLGAPD